MADLIDPNDLVPMDLFTSEPIKIDLVYADSKHPENIFGTAVYHDRARLTLHRDLARVVILTSRTLHEEHGWTLILKDGLRTVDAQEALMGTHTARNNPQWLEGPNRLLSLPGQGAHPCGMAIDVSVKCADMGTRFDEMTAQSARGYTGFPEDILENRRKLESAFIKSAQKLSLPMLPLPSEWWDFRFPASYHEQWVPLRDKDLPAALRMVESSEGDEHSVMRFDNLAKEVLNSI